MAAKSQPGAVSDEQLALRAQQGSVESFEELARRVQVRLVRFLRMYAGQEDAEDLAQEALIRAYCKLDRYRPTWTFTTWVLTIARRLSMNRRRRRRPTVDMAAVERAIDGRPEPFDVVAADEQRDRFWRWAAASLTEQQLVAVWLFYVERLSVKEVARVVNCSRVAVRALLFRARKRLIESLPIDQAGKEDGGPHAQRDPRGGQPEASPRDSARPGPEDNDHAGRSGCAEAASSTENTRRRNRGPLPNVGRLGELV